MTGLLAMPEDEPDELFRVGILRMKDGRYRSYVAGKRDPVAGEDRVNEFIRFAPWRATLAEAEKDVELIDAIVRKTAAEEDYVVRIVRQDSDIDLG